VTTTIPKRVSLVAQTAELLRARMEEGLWGKMMPGELALCNELQISRVTLRSALALLEKEGWFTSDQGRRRRITRQTVTPPSRSRRTTVALLSPVARLTMPASMILGLVALRECLESGGYKLEIVTNTACFSRHPARALEELHRKLLPACYILHLSTEAMQRWFSERRLGCLVTGSCHPNVNFPSVDIDYAAVCHHAVGRLASAGRRRLTLLMPFSDQAGNLESERGFLAAGHQSPHKSLQTTVAHHDGTVASVCRIIDRLIGATPPLDGLLVAKPTHVITSICQLLRRGARIPEDISVISRDDDPSLDSLVPIIARYQSDPSKFARRVARLTIATISGVQMNLPAQRFMPDFSAGCSLQ
jgi:DNA-binding LacI/PurR family transcriptional regulator